MPNQTQPLHIFLIKTTQNKTNLNRKILQIKNFQKFTKNPAKLKQRKI